ncbi:MAG: AMP-binding protein [Oscillospiraceae bacterium]|nr:AMP-binding protein [Oscillospiraceae bacterium]
MSTMKPVDGKNTEQKIKEVAQRIRSLREDLGITIDEMADRTGFSVDEYTLFESGEQDFSFTFIHKCAGVFDVDITELMEGHSPELTGYTVTRKGEGMPIVRRTGFVYNRLAHKFKDKIAEPFHVVIPYSEEALSRPLHLGSHAGQEMDIVVKGTLRMIIGSHTETLHEGDCIYYDSSIPHDEIALGGEDCEIYAFVMNPKGSGMSEYHEKVQEQVVTNVDKAGLSHPVAERFISCETDENGVLSGINFRNADRFNFAFDVVDAIAEKTPDKLAMIHVSEDYTERRFTFSDIKRYSCQTANYFKSLGIQRGDRVMLVLKRHYQFWFSILALHRLGAIVIPATNQLMKHDFEYRFQAAGVSAVVCTADGSVADEIDLAAAQCPELKVKVLVGGKRDGWQDFNDDLPAYSTHFRRAEDAPCGTDPMLMFFTSGTTGYPKIALHSFQYPLGHYTTARYWHNVDPNGIHFTISDTGWGKALWGKLYGQWLCETAVFVYDFDRFHADDILKMFAKYSITSFCAPPTMYRFFIKEDLSKYDLTSLKYATIAGEALNPEVFHQFKRATGLSLMEGFGQTETTLAIANFVGMTPKPGSMGRPNPLFDVQILSAEGTPVGAGETGEICIRLKEDPICGLSLGYYRDEENTKAAWHDGYYHTGDTAWQDEDGYYWYVGRVDDLIKSSGYRIGPFEIESVIMELPYVLECAVTGVPDEIRGQVVKATIVLTEGTDPSDALKKEIQEYVKNATAPYKYPRVVEFRDSLPKTVGSGKIRRSELRKEDAQKAAKDESNS